MARPAKAAPRSPRAERSSVGLARIGTQGKPSDYKPLRETKPFIQNARVCTVRRLERHRAAHRAEWRFKCATTRESGNGV